MRASRERTQVSKSITPHPLEFRAQQVARLIAVVLSPRIAPQLERLGPDRESKGTFRHVAIIRSHRGPLHGVTSRSKRGQRISE
jgi:hypothetical protein